MHASHDTVTHEAIEGNNVHGAPHSLAATLSTLPKDVLISVEYLSALLEEKHSQVPVHGLLWNRYDPLR